MASRSIAIKITIDNRDAINNAKAQVIAMNGLNDVTEKHTHLQNGLTNSFIKGNLAARAISASYIAIRDSLQFAIAGAIEFEHTLTKISAITNTTGGSLRSLEATIRGIAVATNQDQNALAKTALEMGKIGLSGKQVEDSLLSVAQLAKALDEDLVRTGETVVAILNTYGISAEHAGRVTDQLAYTVKASALSIETFSTAFAYVGGTAAAAGVSIEELQASMDVLSNSGIKASTIGTQLRRIIADLSSESSKAGLALGGKTLNDYKSFADTLDALAAKHLTISDYTEIFGRTASSVISILVKYRETMRGLAEETGKQEGLTQRMSTEMGTTLKSAIDGVRVAWAEFGIEIMKSDGFLKSFLKNLKDAINTVNERNILDNQIKAFKAQDPKGYAAVKSRTADNPMTLLSGIAMQDFVSESTEFQKFLSDQRVRDNLEKTKANIVDEIKSILDDGVAKELVKSSEDLSNQIPIKKGFEYRFQQLAKMYIGASDEFLLSVRKAQVKLAQELEPRNTDSQTGGDDKAPKNRFVNFRGNALKANMADQALIDKEYQKRWAKDTLGEVTKNDITKDVTAAWNEYNSLINTNKRLIEEDIVAHIGMQAAIQGVNGSIGILSTYFVEGIFSDKKDPFKGISDAFGDFSKQLAADMLALGLKILIFKGILAGLTSMGAGTGPLGFFGGLASAVVPGFKFASGTDRYVDSPTLFMAGESGREKVTVTPRSKVGQGSGGGNIVVNIQGNVFGGEAFTEAVEQAQRKLKKDRV